MKMDACTNPARNTRGMLDSEKHMNPRVKLTILKTHFSAEELKILSNAKKAWRLRAAQPPAVVSLCSTLGGSVMCFSSCSFVINQCLRLLSGTPWLRTMNARRLFESALKFVSYMTRNSARCLNTCLHILKNLLRWLHCTKLDVLHHSQHGGARSMGAGYVASYGCNIASRTVWT